MLTFLQILLVRSTVNKSEISGFLNSILLFSWQFLSKTCTS